MGKRIRYWLVTHPELWPRRMLTFTVVTDVKYYLAGLAWVAPAKSNGCLGYIASELTVPPSLTVSFSSPLQIWISWGGLTVAVLPQLPKSVGEAQSSQLPEPEIVARGPADPQTVPFKSPERLPAGLVVGAANVSQKAAVPLASPGQLPPPVPLLPLPNFTALPPEALGSVMVLAPLARVPFSAHH